MVNGSAKSPEKKPADGRRSTRGRTPRSESPSAAKKTPARKIATPRRPRKGRGALASVDESASVEPESINGDAAPLQETVKVEVETTTKPSDSGDEEIETTKVNVEMPAGHPELPLPDDTQEMLEVARRMVKEAQKVSGGPSTSKGKRKAEEMIDEDDEVGIEGPAPTTKRARKMEVELRKEKIKRRALTGIAASLAIGYVFSPSSQLHLKGFKETELTYVGSALIPSILAAFGVA